MENRSFLCLSSIGCGAQACRGNMHVIFIDLSSHIWPQWEEAFCRDFPKTKWPQKKLMCCSFLGTIFAKKAFTRSPKNRRREPEDSNQIQLFNLLQPPRSLNELFGIWINLTPMKQCSCVGIRSCALCTDPSFREANLGRWKMEW